MNAENILIGAGIGWAIHSALVLLWAAILCTKPRAATCEFNPHQYVSWALIFILAGTVIGALK